MVLELRRAKSLFVGLFVLIGTTSVRADEPVVRCSATDQELPSDAAANQVRGLRSFPLANGNAVVDAAEAFASAAKNCTKETKTAQMACTEGCSAPLSDGRAQAAKTSNEMKGTAQANGASKKAAVALEQEAGGFRAFLADCSPKLDKCQASCKDALDKLDALENAIKGVRCESYSAVNATLFGQCKASLAAAANAVSAVAKKERRTDDIKSRGGKSTECNGTLANNKKKADSALGGLDKAITAALGAALQNMASSGSGSGGTASAASDAAALDCAGKDAGTSTCLCQTNPRSCNQQVAVSTGIGVNAGAGSTSSSGSSGSGASAPSTTLDPNRDPAGLPVGTGTGGGGGSGVGAGGGTPSPAPSSGTVLPASAGARASAAGLYTGYEGGNGGSGYDSAGDSEGDAKRTKSNSLARGLMGANARRPEMPGLTSSGGRSNWEKISNRYVDNSPTLLKEATSPAKAK